MANNGLLAFPNFDNSLDLLICQMRLSFNFERFSVTTKKTYMYSCFETKFITLTITTGITFLLHMWLKRQRRAWLYYHQSIHISIETSPPETVTNNYF